MSGRTASLTRPILREHLRSRVFQSPTQDRVGAEVEGIAVVQGRPRMAQRESRAACDRVWRALAARSGVDDAIRWHGGRLTREPGGQWEHSGRPCRGAGRAALEAWAAWERVARAGRREGVTFHPIGFNPWQTVEGAGLQSTGQRYAAMQRYFDRNGPYGRRMMRLTASVQVTVDCGADELERRERWELALRLAPLLAAVFANSAVEEGRPVARAGLRQETWLRLDPLRTGFPARFLEDPAVDPVAAYLDFALRAPLMFMTTDSGPYLLPDRELSFERWMIEGHEAGEPDLTDWETHLSTLFPYVRVRGYYELRSADAPGLAWIGVPVLMGGLAVGHPAARKALLDLLRPWHGELPGLAVAAAEHGLEDERLAALCRELFRIVRQHARGVEDRLLAAYAARYVETGRSPGAELRSRIQPGKYLEWADLMDLERERLRWLASENVVSGRFLGRLGMD